MTIKSFAKLVVLLVAVFWGYTYLFSTSISQIEADITTNLIGHWKMDEASWNGTANEVIDSSGNGYHGTAQNGLSTAASGIIGSKGFYDGVNDYIDIPTFPTINGINSSTAWVYIDSLSPGINYYIHKMGGTNFYWMQVYDITGTGKYILRGGTQAAGGQYCDSVTEIVAGRWYNFGRTFDGSTSRMYINGILECSVATSTVSSSGLDIGSPTPNGSIDEVRFYNKVLTTSDLDEIYELGIPDTGVDLADSLIGYWKMDESSWNGTPNEVIDSSSGGYDGVAQNGLTTTNGILGNAGTYDGVNDTINVTSFPSISGANSSSAWVYINSLSPGASYYINNVGAGNQYWMQIYDNTGSGNYVFRSGVSGVLGEYCDSSTNIVAGQWYNFARTFDGVTSKGYINGTLACTVNAAAITDSALYIGSGGNPIYGLIDEVRFYDRKLTTPEVQQIYSLGTVTNQVSCPASVQARFQIDGIGLYQTGTFSQSFVNEGSPFQWSVLMNGDVAQIFGGDVTLTKPDTSTVNLTSANGVDIDNPAQIGTYSISAKATNGDVCATASVTIVADPPVCTAASIAGVGITTVSGDTDVTSVAVCGTNDVYVRNTDGDITAKMTVDLNTGRDWRAMAADNKTSAENNGGAGTALLHFPGGASEIPGLVGGSFTLYVPREAGDDYVRICPGAETLSELSGACIGGVNLSVGTTGQYTVTQVTLETRDLWEIAGVTGTGGLGVQEGRTVYIDLDAQPATLPSTISTAPEVAVSTADEFYLSYIPTSTEFGIGDAVDIVIPFDWTGLATCATSTTDADGDATGDGALAVVDTQIIRYTFTATTTLSLTTGVEFCFAATSSPTVGNYSIAMSDTNDGDFAPALIYVGDDNDVTISATIPITLSLRIKEELTTADTNACNLGVLNPGSVNSCSYRIAAGTNISTGLQVFVSADNQLNTAGDTSDIDDTAGGGTITAGTEEHGILLDLGTSWTVGGSFSESTDEPMPLTSTLILDAAAAISDSSEVFWNKVTHSASVNSGTAGGSYDQLVTYRAWVDT